MYFFIFTFLLFWTGESESGNNLYYTKNGVITFSSVAQQEIIKATSDKLTGVLDPSRRTFLFKVLIRSFEGFNSTLQQEHFNEKYMESEKYPEATFSGKIIEDLDLTLDGEYDVRAKGKLKIHGKEVERIIRSKVSVKNGNIKIESEFRILLSDYNIKVPKVVHEKIASEIMIDLKIELNRNYN